MFTFAIDSPKAIRYDWPAGLRARAAISSFKIKAGIDFLNQALAFIEQARGIN
jgi:hypothetical protein